MVIDYMYILKKWEKELDSIEFGSNLFLRKMERVAWLSRWEDHHREKCNHVKWSFK